MRTGTLASNVVIAIESVQYEENRMVETAAQTVDDTLPLVVQSYPVPKDDKPARYEAGKASDALAMHLSKTTGLDHVARWDRNLWGYVVFRKPLVVPDAPWSEDNQPERRTTDWTAMPSQVAPLDRLLVEAVRLKPSQWLYTNELAKDVVRFVADLQAALDMQYGRGRYWANRHGARVYVQCRFPAAQAA